MGQLIQSIAPTYHYIVSEEIKTELIRKSLHILIAFVPFLASINLIFTMLLLGTGIIIYVLAENARHKGYRIFIISDLTISSSRKKDIGKFVMGPVTLGVGAMLCLLLYPHIVSTIAIYALAFGDSMASLVGKAIGKLKLPFAKGKTFAGSLSCFIVIFLITYYIIGNAVISFFIGLAATVLEAFPTNDMDNIIMPIGTGFFTSMLLPFIM